MLQKATENARARAAGAGGAGAGEDDDGHGHGQGGPAPGGVKITFWKNGFTVDDGLLRKPEDPANKEFLESVERGRVPPELEARARASVRERGTVLDITIEERRTEDFVEPPYRAFGGSAHTVGGGEAARPPASAVVSGSASSRAIAPVDETKERTTIIVKLANGKREKVVLNLTHTVADLQAKVASLGDGGRGFVLTAGFPPKPLANASETVEAAGLKNSAVTQVMQQQ